jgi:hypothetical protein
VTEATITFNLPEEGTMYNDALNASKWRKVCEELDEYLRNQAIMHDMTAISIDAVRSKLIYLLMKENLYLHE